MRFGLAVAAVIAILDQLAKGWVVHFFHDEADLRSVPLGGALNLVLTMNRGMSFGLFNTNAAFSAAIFTVIALCIVTGLLWWLHLTHDPLLWTAIGLVIGGALGNVVDRVWRGAVVDFLDFHLGGWHWFAFNLADAAISVGVGLMVIDGLLGDHRRH
jgi:signal peptidase II